MSVAGFLSKLFYVAEQSFFFGVLFGDQVAEVIGLIGIPINLGLQVLDLVRIDRISAVRFGGSSLLLDVQTPGGVTVLTPEALKQETNENFK